MLVRRVPTLGRAVRPTDDLRPLSALVAALRRFRPHIVHTHTAKAGALGRAAAVLARVPARVHTFHVHLRQGYFSPAKTRLVIQAERGLAAVTDRLVAVGCSVRDDLLAAGIGRPGQYAVVPPGTTPRPHLPGARRHASSSAFRTTASPWPRSDGSPGSSGPTGSWRWPARCAAPFRPPDS
ncbi:glycosyltransferase [Streptomyces dysideae]|uniref:glycosyltransferase n=1 Tax=Streptomyces dysideae TaxID=909626 RepID=UPI00099ED83E